MSTIGGSITTSASARAGAIHLLLLLLLLLSHPLFIEHLLALNGGQETVVLDVFGVIMANTLLLHLFVFLQQS